MTGSLPVDINTNSRRWGEIDRGRGRTRIVAVAAKASNLEGGKKGQ